MSDEDGQRLPESDTEREYYFASCPYSQEPHHFTSDPPVQGLGKVSDAEAGHSRCEDKTGAQTRPFNLFEVFKYPPLFVIHCQIIKNLWKH
jgi:hypothetical protein